MNLDNTQLSSRIDRDKLNMLSRDRAAECGFLFLDKAGEMKPEEIVMGAAIAFAAVASRYSQSASELHDLGLKLLTAPHPHHKGGNALLDALQDYAKLRVRNDPKL